MKEAHDHKRVTAEGKKLGEQLVRINEAGIRKLEKDGEPDERCKTCAFRLGTVPNGCPQTVLDALKAVTEGVPFLCHSHQDENGEFFKICHGWYAARVALKGLTFKMPYEFSPADE